MSQPDRIDASTETAPFTVRRLGAALAGEVTGLDLAETLGDNAITVLRQALLDHQVLVIRGQDHITPEQQLAFAACWGEISIHPYIPSIEGHSGVMKIYDPVAVTQTWHADSTHRKDPPAMSFLLARILPAVGGDTMFASASGAYEALSPGLKETLLSLRAVHKGTALAAEAGLGEDDVTAVHPVVRTHPESGVKAIFVNGNYVSHFEGWTPEESKPLLDYLYGQIGRAENVYRHRWQAGDMLIWDNRCTHHAVVGDTAGAERVLHRVTVSGTIPR